jgi:hypothetical protein
MQGTGARNAITPAGAIPPEAVHPRVRGERCGMILRFRIHIGSSPRARGTPFAQSIV